MQNTQIAISTRISRSPSWWIKVHMGISTLRFEVPAAELGQTLAILAVGHYGFLLYHKLVPIAGKLDLFGDGVAIKKVKEQHSERFKQEARSIAAFAESVATRIAGGS